VWLYYRFPLSHRDVEDLLAERGVQVSYEAIRLWCRTFGPMVAAGLRRCRRRAGGTSTRCSSRSRQEALALAGLWTAKGWCSTFSSKSGATRRPPSAASWSRRVLDGEERALQVVVTDKLASYPPALRRVLPCAEHRRHKGLNLPWLAVRASSARSASSPISPRRSAA